MIRLLSGFNLGSSCLGLVALFFVYTLIQKKTSETNNKIDDLITVIDSKEISFDIELGKVRGKNNTIIIHAKPQFTQSNLLKTDTIKLIIED